MPGGRMWSREEVAGLYQLREVDGMDFAEIGRILDRSAAACRAKAQSEAYHDIAKSERLATELLNNTMQAMLRHSPVVRVDPALYGRESSGQMVEVDLFDWHFAMLAWGLETAGQNWDLKLAREMWEEKLAEVVAVLNAYKVDYVLLPTGNDLVHFDAGWGVANSGGMTSAGTILDVDSRYKHVYVAVRELLVQTIETLALAVPRVIVPIITGNHSGLTEFTLGDSLYCWFHNDERVEINNSPQVRKYHTYGRTLIGYTHGHVEPINQLPQIMAYEAKESWAATEWHEWHIGHRHRRKGSIYVPMEDMGKGVVVIEMASITPKDAWTYLKGLVGSRRSCEARLYDVDHGLRATFHFNAVD